MRRYLRYAALQRGYLRYAALFLYETHFKSIETLQDLYIQKYTADHCCSTVKSTK